MSESSFGKSINLGFFWFQLSQFFYKMSTETPGFTIDPLGANEDLEEGQIVDDFEEIPEPRLPAPLDPDQAPTISKVCF